MIWCQQSLPTIHFIVWFVFIVTFRNVADKLLSFERQRTRLNEKKCGFLFSWNRSINRWPNLCIYNRTKYEQYIHKHDIVCSGEPLTFARRQKIASNFEDKVVFFLISVAKKKTVFTFSPSLHKTIDRRETQLHEMKQIFMETRNGVKSEVQPQS